MERDSVITVCYLGIVIFIMLIFIPPFFRWLDRTPKIASSDIDIKKLVCNKTEILEDDIKVTLSITNTYNNENLNNTSFKYTIINPINIDETVLIQKSSILAEREELKKISEAIVENDTIKFKFNESNSSNSMLNKFTGKYDEQKAININYGFLCE